MIARGKRRAPRGASPLVSRNQIEKSTESAKYGGDYFALSELHCLRFYLGATRFALAPGYHISRLWRCADSIPTFEQSRGCAAVRLCGCAAVRLCGCAAVGLCGWAAGRRCGWAAVRLGVGAALGLCRGAVLRLCGGAAGRLCGCAAVRLCGCAAVRLCGCAA